MLQINGTGDQNNPESLQAAEWTPTPLPGCCTDTSTCSAVHHLLKTDSWDHSGPREQNKGYCCHMQSGTMELKSFCQNNSLQREMMSTTATTATRSPRWQGRKGGGLAVHWWLDFQSKNEGIVQYQHRLHCFLIDKLWLWLLYPTYIIDPHKLYTLVL